MHAYLHIPTAWFLQALERQLLKQLQQHLLHPLAALVEDQLRARAAATCIPGTRLLMSIPRNACKLMHLSKSD